MKNKYDISNWHPELKSRFLKTGSSGFAFTDAILFHDCPHCAAKMGYYCTSPSGRKTDTPHGKRVKKLKTNIDIPKNISYYNNIIRKDSYV